jgi:hypothetical protein
MLDNIDKIKRKYLENKDNNLNEGNTRSALITPFIDTVLGYDVSNPNEVDTEFSTGFGRKKK